MAPRITMLLREIHSAEASMSRGHSRRRSLKRSEQAIWDPQRRSLDPLDLLIAANRDRMPELLPIKMARMAVSPFAFFRGSVPLMAADLATLPVTHLDVRICGDAHVHNLGAFAGPDGRLYFDINDFDETVVGPWEWDIKRLAASLVLAGREAGDSDELCLQSVRVFMRTYREAMLRFAAMPRLEIARYRVHRQFVGPPGKNVLRKAERATPQQNLEKLTLRRRNGTYAFRDRKPLLTPVSKLQAAEVLNALVQYRQTLLVDRRHLFDFYRPVDVAFKIVGTGSVATRDYVVLYFADGPHDPLFLQVKEEPPSSYAPFLKGAPGVANQGQRVVEGQRAIQTQSDLLLGWTAFGGRDYLVRQLSDHKASIADEDLRGKGLAIYAHTCGELLAKGHARSGDPCALAGYIGAGPNLDKAIQKFAKAYADQVTLDYEKFRDAIRSGSIKAARSSF
ncbi:MAG TPA: DUF2252 domain-containing protein [Terriglobales bacterium]|nr:DUF2252 domain-containing protein [Terriglobales bacterium]